MFKAKIILLSLALLGLSCQRNHKPYIAELSCTPASGVAGMVFTLKVIASDDDGDVLSYLWTADEGSFITMTNVREVKWKSPAAGGGKVIPITVSVSDGDKEATRICQISLGEPELGSVSGMVNFTNFKIPVSGVTISIGGKTATSDLNGSFFIAGIPALDDTLSAIKQDFTAAKSIVKIMPNDTINVALEITSVNYTTKVSGIITDQDGLILENATVIAMNPDGSVSKLKSTTDETGFYRLWYIPLGERIIIAYKDPTDECSYSTLTKTVVLDDLQQQFNLVLKKTSFSGTFIDSRDEHLYSFKMIGYRFWMTENLAYLPEVSPPTLLSTKDACYYVYGYSDTDTAEARSNEKYKQYGVLYNRTALNTACPPGWHAPSNQEWNELYYELDPEPVKKMKSNYGWNGRGNGTNSSGFNVFPAGQVNIEGAFSGAGDGAYLWTTTSVSYLQPGFRGLTSNSDEMSYNKGSEKMGCSVRCIRN